MAYGYKVYVKMTKHIGDGSTVSDYSNVNGTGYIDAGITLPSSSGYIKSMQGKKQATMLFATTGGSNTTYYCDYGYSSFDSSWYVCHLGGDIGYASLAGLFFIDISYAPSDTHWNVGASLSFKSF